MKGQAGTLEHLDYGQKQVSIEVEREASWSDARTRTLEQVVILQERCSIKGFSAYNKRLR